MADKEEVQRVDQILRIRNKLDEIPDVPDIIQEKLLEHIETIVKTLPPDLQLVLKKDLNNQNESVSTIPIDPVTTWNPDIVIIL